MEAQSNKPHRKGKEKKKHTGGMLHPYNLTSIKDLLFFCAPFAVLLIDRICLQTTPRLLPYTGPGNFKHKLHDRLI